MLSCKEVTERASALIDGELGPLQTLRMRLHLAMCHGCAHFLAQMRATRALTMTTLPSDPPDAARIEAILSRLHDEKPTGG
ncbi:hypothetical protein U879_00055 [Defluviimonas sp. 20V17]|uniref:Zinc-finger n=1 Tax=Allgaiera indica TaxID=765699 RepID=A0AAN4UMX4_9RHOB|nr:zf-HC2 domain-containing protein [Allgaiera indica]KDB05725.1 hypothetical protein U879_00055 [Defluviimonas sp. 20V17]GHD98500.1 hypothetical protein GCM10008024_02260 [Allgaiera indica]SDW12384.1 Putative zinc-finger [Allgaiera indica]